MRISSHTHHPIHVYTYIYVYLSLYIFLYTFTHSLMSARSIAFTRIWSLCFSLRLNLLAVSDRSPSLFFFFFGSFSDVLRDSLVLLLLLLLGFGSRIFGWIIVLKCKFALNGVREDVIVNFLSFDSS